MEIVSIIKSGTVPNVALFKTSDPLTADIFNEFMLELSGHAHLGRKWSQEGEFLKGDFSDTGVPDRRFIENVSYVLKAAARNVQRKQQNQATAAQD